MDESNITKTENIYSNENGNDVFRGFYGDLPVAIKSFHRKDISVYGDYFINELINSKLIHSIIEEDKSAYFAEFIGFTLNNSNDPYFGNILIKFYPIGDLMQFTRKLSNPKKFKIEKKDRSDEIILLVDLAKQIAEGKFIMNHLSTFGMNYLYQIPK